MKQYKAFGTGSYNNGFLCLVPQGMSGVSDILSYIEENKDSYVKFPYLSADRCKYPYYIEEDVAEIGFKSDKIELVRAEALPIYLMPLEEYKARLMEVIKTKCINCSNYTDNSELGDADLMGHFNKINLDGECDFYNEEF